MSESPNVPNIDSFSQARDDGGRFIKGESSWNKGKGMTADQKAQARAETLKKYNNSPERKAKMREYAKLYKASGRRAEVLAKYDSSEKGITTKRANGQRRISRERALTKPLNMDYWRWLCAFLDYRCQLCGKQLPYKKLTIDHQLPIARGGDNDEWNLQPLCGPCNSSKQDRLIGIDNIYVDIAYGEWLTCQNRKS